LDLVPLDKYRINGLIGEIYRYWRSRPFWRLHIKLFSFWRLLLWPGIAIIKLPPTKLPPNKLPQTKLPPNELPPNRKRPNGHRPICHLRKSDQIFNGNWKNGPSHDSYMINYHFPRRVANKSFTRREFKYLFLSDQQKILINCILKYFEGSHLKQKSNSRQSLGEF